MWLHFISVLELGIVDDEMIRIAMAHARRNTQIMHQPSEIGEERTHEHCSMTQHVQIGHDLHRIRSRQDSRRSSRHLMDRTQLQSLSRFTATVHEFNEIIAILTWIPVAFVLADVSSVRLEACAKEKQGMWTVMSSIGGGKSIRSVVSMNVGSIGR